MQLVEVKAVEGDYPLRGRLAVGRDPSGAPVPTDVVPEPGTAWPDAQLAQVLKLAPGQCHPSNGPIQKRWHAMQRPTIFVLDASGFMRYKNVKDQALDEAVDTLLAELAAKSDK